MIVKVFLLRISDGIPSIIPLKKLQSLALNGKNYFLIPADISPEEPKNIETQDELEEVINPDEDNFEAQIAIKQEEPKVKKSKTSRLPTKDDLHKLGWIKS